MDKKAKIELLKGLANGTKTLADLDAPPAFQCVDLCQITSNPDQYFDRWGRVYNNEEKLALLASTRAQVVWEEISTYKSMDAARAAFFTEHTPTLGEILDRYKLPSNAERNL